jgi:hypothetical protein
MSARKNLRTLWVVEFDQGNGWEANGNAFSSKREARDAARFDGYAPEGVPCRIQRYVPDPTYQAPIERHQPRKATS